MLLLVLFNISALPARHSVLGNIIRPHLLMLARRLCTSMLKQSGNLKASCELGVYCHNKACKHEWGFALFFFFLNRGHKAPSLSDHRNWAIQSGPFNVGCRHNLMHSRAHKHVDPKGNHQSRLFQNPALKHPNCFSLVPFHPTTCPSGQYGCYYADIVKETHFLKACLCFFQ